MFKLKLLAASLLVAAFSLTTGCSPQAKHPNQINAFDAATYDSLTVARAALVSLRPTIAANYPQYKPAFNQATSAYKTAYDTYAAFRTLPSGQAAAAVAVANLTVTIVDLENTLQGDLHVQPQTVLNTRSRAAAMRAANPRISISDVLTELEIAASIASSVPGAAPYATIAKLVIQTTQIAVEALKASSGQMIDLSTLTPILPIS